MSRIHTTHIYMLLHFIFVSVACALSAGPTGIERPWFRARQFETRGVYSDRPMLPLNEISERIGVPPPIEAPRWRWKVAWSIGKRALPILHRWDDCAPTDTNVNLWVCWLKAIGGNSRRGYPDGGLAYDLLPPVTRRVVARPLARLYPLLHHQNVALRSAFLDQHVQTACERAAADGASSPSSSPVVVVALGAGFDLRSLRLRSAAARACRWVEIDLPHVIEQRGRLLTRLTRRRPDLDVQRQALLSLSANLSVAEEVQATLREALAPSGVASASGAGSARGAGSVIFVCEVNARQLAHRQSHI